MENNDFIEDELRYKIRKLEIKNKQLEEEILILNKIKDMPLKKIIYKEIIKRRKCEVTNGQRNETR